MNAPEEPGQPTGGGRLWCEGLPLSETRPLTASERAALVTETRRRAVEAAGALLVVPAAPTLAVLLLVFAIHVIEKVAGQRAGAWLIAPFLVVLIGGPTVGILWARTALPRAIHTFSDLRRGRILRFVATEDSERREIELLASSRRVWSTNGERVGGWMRIPPAFVAPQPRGARIAAEWLRPLPVDSDRRVLAGTRALAAEERAEIRRHALALLRPRGRSVAILAMWGLLTVAMRIMGYASSVSSLPAAVGGSLFVLLAYAKQTQLLRAVELLRDAANGRVLILRDDGLEDGEPARPVEILPRSRIVWTAAGVPVSWRYATAAER